MKNENNILSVIIPEKFSHLLATEQKAAMLVERIGLSKANQLLTKLGDHMERRAKKYNDGRVYFDYAFTAMSVAHQRETELMHLLKIGLCLLDTYNTPAAAAQRLRARREARREARRVEMAERKAAKAA